MLSHRSLTSELYCTNAVDAFTTLQSFVAPAMAMKRLPLWKWFQNSMFFRICLWSMLLEKCKNRVMTMISIHNEPHEFLLEDSISGKLLNLLVQNCFPLQQSYTSLAISRVCNEGNNRVSIVRLTINKRCSYHERDDLVGGLVKSNPNLHTVVVWRLRSKPARRNPRIKYHCIPRCVHFFVRTRVRSLQSFNRPFSTWNGKHLFAFSKHTAFAKPSPWIFRASWSGSKVWMYARSLTNSTITKVQNLMRSSAGSQAGQDGLISSQSLSQVSCHLCPMLPLNHALHAWFQIEPVSRLIRHISTWFEAGTDLFV